MQMSNRSKTSQTSRQYMNYAAYLLFFVYMIYLLINEPQTATRIVYLAMLVVFGSIAILYEVLKSWSVQAMTALTIQCDPAAGLAKLAKLQKLDFFKSFRTFALVFKTLATEDLEQPQDLLAWLDQAGTKPFSTSLDLRLVYLHSLYRANLMLDRKDQAKEYFQSTMNLKDKKVLNKKITPLYAWDQIVAEYQFYNGNYKEARKSLAKVNTANLNPRERAYYDLLDGKISIKEQAMGTAREKLTAVVAAAGKTSLAAQAETLLAGI
jgi:hypothetical protein